METTRISVIIPIYNAERYLCTCIESVLNQTYPNTELLLIDDGSTDNSLSLCEGYAEKDPRIRILRRQNEGVASARNAGIQAALGEWIAFLDADDYWNPRFLESLLNAAGADRFPICKVFRFSEEVFFEYRYPYGEPDEPLWPIKNHIPISCWRGLYRTEILRNSGLTFTRGRRTGEDQEFAYRYLLLVPSAVYVPEAVYYYRKHPDSCMHGFDYRHFDSVEAMKSVEAYAKEIGTADAAETVRLSFRRYCYPQMLEFAILTLFNGGEPDKTVFRYLREHGYDRMLDDAVNEPDHFRSDFLTRWEKSPKRCLRHFYLRKKWGRLLRKARLLRKKP